MEVGIISTVDQSSLATLPEGQQTRLVSLGLDSGVDVNLSRKVASEPRLVAAARIFAATSEEQLLERSLEQLGMLSQALHTDVEVRVLGLLSLPAAHKICDLHTRLVSVA